MMSRVARRVGTPMSYGCVPIACQRSGQVRNAATLKDIAIRMKSVKSIQKITKAMKMVSAAKMKQDERRVKNGLPWCKPVLDLFQRLPREDKLGTIYVIGVTGDKGLCGGVNSAVTKKCRLTILDEEAKGNSAKFIGVGAKGGGGLKRIFGDRFTSTMEGITKVPWSFTTAAIIAERIVEANPERAKLVGNTFKSMVAYDTYISQLVTKKDAQSMDRAEFSKAMDVYSFEPAIYEVWDDLHEFYYGAVIHSAHLNNAITEQSQRVAAMENASKNAGEMLEKLSLIYNRARQSKITTELCEIISGASAVS